MLGRIVPLPTARDRKASKRKSKPQAARLIKQSVDRSGTAELADKGADIDVLRQPVQFTAQRLMELDVEGRCGSVPQLAALSGLPRHCSR